MSEEKKFGTCISIAYHEDLASRTMTNQRRIAEQEAWKAAAMPYLESMLWTYSDKLETMTPELLEIVDVKSVEENHCRLKELVSK